MSNKDNSIQIMLKMQVGNVTQYMGFFQCLAETATFFTGSLSALNLVQYTTIHSNFTSTVTVA